VSLSFEETTFREGYGAWNGKSFEMGSLLSPSSFGPDTPEMEAMWLF
jgi:hypothetical protein